MNLTRRGPAWISAALVAALCAPSAGAARPNTGPLAVSPNGRFLQQAGGRPFFWLGDTAWLLF